MSYLVVSLPLCAFIFIIMPLLCVFVRVRSETLAKLYPTRGRGCARHNHNYNCRPSCAPQMQAQAVRNVAARHLWQQNGITDRQGNIFTIDGGLSTGSTQYGDIFFIEPNSDEAARIRSQMEKDDKDLPSYEEVMRMNNLATPTAGIGVPIAVTATDNTTTASVELPLEVPPYSEIDPHATTSVVVAVPAASAIATVLPLEENRTDTSGLAPSTSRAAAAAVAASSIAILPVINSTSNSIV